MNGPVKSQILAGIERLIDDSAFTNGPQVASFERAFGGYCERSYCIGLASGLDALRLGLRAAGLQPGDEVIVPAATFIATLEAVTQAGGRPVLVDVNDEDYGLDCAQVAMAITPATSFVMPVHLYGQLVDVRTLQALAAKRGVGLIEDACQAHGASRDGIRAGAVGTAAAFSFYPSKNLGAMGDAGALVTDDAELASRVRALREHGQRAKYEHATDGYTARLDTLQAIVLLAKLPWLDWWNAERRSIAALYSEGLDGIGDLRLPRVPDGSDPVWHLYVVRTRDPERLGAFLADRGISTGRHYPQPLHLSPAYEHLGYRRGEFPVAEALAAEGLSLPIFPGMSEQQLTSVIAAVKDFFARG
jgi:dTDP-4-amino-4,6-dideoxygalactose transaminase